MHRNHELHEDVDHGKNISHSKWPKSTEILSKMFGSIMSGIFGNAKSRMGQCYKVRRSDSNGRSLRNFTSNPSKMQSFPSFFHGKARTGFIRGKTSETEANIVEICDHIDHLRLPSMENDGKKDGETVRDFGWGRQASKTNWPRVPSRIMTTRHRLKMARSLRKMSSRRIEMKAEQNDEDERQCCGKEELCKKRILLGEKCRPFNNSGTLHYDKDGVLLPDMVPCEHQY